MWGRGVFEEGVDYCSPGLSASLAGGSAQFLTACRKTASSGGLLASLCVLKDQNRKLKGKGHAYIAFFFSQNKPQG